LCEPIGAASEKLDPQHFGQGLTAALAYPVQGPGLVMLLAVAGLNAALAMTGRWMLFAGFAWILGFAVGAYALLFLREVVLSSAQGDRKLPPWPVANRESLGEVVLEFTGLYLISFGPWTLCRVWLHPETEMMRWVCYALLGFGLLYFPMALLAVVMHDHLAAANPVLVAVSVCRSPSRYLAVCGFLAMLAGVAWLVERGVASLGPPFLGAALSSFASGYVTLAAMRAIGWFYFCSKEQLAWS
jgi:hypothetical protein